MTATHQPSRAMRSIFRLSFLLSAAASSTARGQLPTADTLSAVIISASKTPVSRNQLTQAVTVITGEALRERGVTRVSDALMMVPGVSVASNGSVGSVTSLFLRGG